MAKVSTSRSYDVPAADLWTKIGGFLTLDEWHPAIASCESLEGGRRKLTTVDGAEVFETLTGQEDGQSYSYKIDDSPLPVADYTAQLTANATGERSCTVVWTAAFEVSGASDAEAEAVIKGIFDAGLDALP